MICENCSKDHEGLYATGRFCSQQCARSFSTKSKRKEINKKVSKALAGKPNNCKGKPGKKHTEESKEKISKGLKEFFFKHPELIKTEEQKAAKNAADVAEYRARKRKATPPDADLELIKKIYESCPKGYHVDHILAIARGGLHHQDNLQYLPGSENCRKSADREYNVKLAIQWKDLLSPKLSD